MYITCAKIKENVRIESLESMIRHPATRDFGDPGQDLSITGHPVTQSLSDSFNCTPARQKIICLKWRFLPMKTLVQLSRESNMEYEDGSKIALMK